jgi:hypothetical protein
MLARDQENIPKTFRHQVPRLANHSRDIQRHPQDRVVAGETAVGAVVDAFVRDVERREKANRPSEMPPRDCSRLRRQRGQRAVIHWLEQRLKALQRRRQFVFISGHSRSMHQAAPPRDRRV